MKLTIKEKEICEKYSAYDETGHVHCCDCPLLINLMDCLCYANIDGRTTEAKKLKRY